MKINYHIHTTFSGDNALHNRTGETPEKYAEAAMKLGFSEICFTDHLVIGYPLNMPVYEHGMDPKKLKEYFRKIALAAKKYPQIKIKTGIELDWLPEKLDEIKKLLSQYPFDCVLGSVHSINGVKVEQMENSKAFWEKLSEEEIYEKHAEYYRAVQEMAKSRICDIVAHLDLVKRDGYIPKKSLMPLVEEMLDVILKNNLCIEINTLGMRKAVKEIHPTFEILKLCRKKGIHVTIGTDAHKVERLDFYFEDGMKMIKDAGYAELAVFEKRKRSMIKI